MAECKTYSSLFALVDSHLSKINLQGNESNDSPETPEKLQRSTVSSDAVNVPKVFGADRILPIPKLGLSESPIKNVLANQVANMLMAKEKRQEEKKKDSFMDVDDDDSESNDDFIIDFTQAIQSSNSKHLNQRDTVLSSSSSCESLFKLQFKGEEDTEKSMTPEPCLPCVTDMSYILGQRIYKGKCSAFGKVLTSKIRPVAPWYTPTILESKINKFHFNTPSPCDLIKEKLRKPTVSCHQVQNIFE